MLVHSSHFIAISFIPYTFLVFSFSLLPFALKIPRSADSQSMKPLAPNKFKKSPQKVKLSCLFWPAVGRGPLILIDGLRSRLVEGANAWASPECHNNYL